MALTKNSDINAFKLDTFKAKNDVYAYYFSLSTNVEASIAKKFKLLTWICYLEQKMKAINPEKFPDCVSLLKVIFNRDFTDPENHTGEDYLLSGLAIICDDLLWGTTDELPTPDGFTNLKEIKNAIIEYVRSEWLPF
jgi:hypothetical protein